MIRCGCNTHAHTSINYNISCEVFSMPIYKPVGLGLNPSLDSQDVAHPAVHPIFQAGRSMGISANLEKTHL